MKDGMRLKRSRKFVLLKESIEEGLRILLDDSAVRSFFSHMQEAFSVERSKIGQKPELFSVELESIFGLGASKIEKVIVALLYSKLGMDYKEVEGYKFADYVSEAREHGKIGFKAPRAKLMVEKDDLKIISALEGDARKTITQLAKETHLSRPTVTVKLDKLVKKNIVQVKAGLNIKKLEFPIAQVALEIRGAELRQKIEKHLINCPRVSMFCKWLYASIMLTSFPT